MTRKMWLAMAHMGVTEREHEYAQHPEIAAHSSVQLLIEYDALLDGLR